MNAAKADFSLLAVFTRGSVFAFIWWALTDGVAQSWWIGVPAVSLAVITSVALLPPVTFVWIEFLKFLPVFLIRSLLGGVDVARRVFQPAMPIAPDIVQFPLRLPPGLARVFMVNIVSLLPGTLIAELGTDDLTIHVLDVRNDYRSELESIERSVALMFGISMNAPEGYK